MTYKEVQRAYDEMLPEDYWEPRPEEVYRLEEWEDEDGD